MTSRAGARQDEDSGPDLPRGWDTDPAGQQARPVRTMQRVLRVPQVWWGLLVLLTWQLVPLATRLRLPRVNPDPWALPGPLEQLGSVAVALAAGLVVPGLRATVPHAERVSARLGAGVRARRLARCLPVVGLGVGLMLAWLPPTVSRGIVGWQVLLWSSVAVLLATWVSDRLAVCLPVLCVALMSLRTALPWTWNVVFNPQAPALVPLACLCAAAALVSWLGWGSAEDRRQS